MIKVPINGSSKPWGPLPVETRVTGPQIFVWGANNAFGPPNFEKFIIIVI